MEEQKTESKAEPANTTQLNQAAQKQKPDFFWKITTVVLIVILAFFAFRGPNLTGSLTGNAVKDTADNNNVLGAAAPARVDFQKVIYTNDHILGNENAPVTIIEWSDFECPFCARFHLETSGALKDQYVKSGKVKFIYKNFPLNFHQNAQKAAEAAECASDQEKFWEMHDLLFEQGVQGGVVTFKQYAKQLGLDTAKFDKCLDSGDKIAKIQKDMADGGKSGIQGTPGFLVNGLMVSGAQPLVVFQQAIEAELN